MCSTNVVKRRYNWTRAWLNIMFFRAAMDSRHGSSSTSIADWPRSECQLKPQPSLAAAGGDVSTPQPPRIHREVPQYGTKFQPFVLRPDNKILVQDGSTRDSSSTMVKVCSAMASFSIFCFDLAEMLLFLLHVQDHHGEKFGANYSIMISKLSAGYEVALGVHISPDKIPNVIQIAKLWAGPVICAILSERSDAIVDQLKLQVPNVDPVFVPPSSDSDHVYVSQRACAELLSTLHRLRTTHLVCCVHADAGEIDTP